MMKSLKLFACLLVALTLALTINVSNARAQSALCDRSLNPTCSTVLYPGDCQELPLPGFNLAQVQISFSGDAVPQIFPPPAMFYELDLGFTKSSDQLLPTATATYDFNPPETYYEGRICNATGDFYGYSLPFEVVWKNVQY